MFCMELWQLLHVLIKLLAEVLVKLVNVAVHAFSGAPLSRAFGLFKNRTVKAIQPTDWPTLTLSFVLQIHTDGAKIITLSNVSW